MSLGRREAWANYILPGLRKFTAPHRAAGGECQLEMFEGREHLWIDKPGPMTDKVLPTAARARAPVARRRTAPGICAAAPGPASRAALCDIGNGVGHYASDRSWPILLKNSIALPGRTSHRKVDRSECAASDASGPGKGSTTPRNQSKVFAEEFFNRIGRQRPLIRGRSRRRNSHLGLLSHLEGIVDFDA